MENKMEEVAKLLGLKLGEKFQIVNLNSEWFQFREEGLFDKDDYRCTRVLGKILCGEHKIKKLPYWETIEFGDRYWTVDIHGKAHFFDYQYGYQDKVHQRAHNMFRTRDEALNKFIAVKQEE